MAYVMCFYKFQGNVIIYPIDEQNLTLESYGGTAYEPYAMAIIDEVPDRCTGSPCYIYQDYEENVVSPIFKSGAEMNKWRKDNGIKWGKEGSLCEKYFWDSSYSFLIITNNTASNSHSAMTRF